MKNTQIQFSAVNFNVKALKNGAEKGYCRFISDKKSSFRVLCTLSNQR